MTRAAVALRPPALRRWSLNLFGQPPLADLTMLIALLPLWWALGIEQWLPPVALGWATVKLLVIRRTVRLTLPLVLMLLLLVAMLASALFIVEEPRYLSFARAFGAHLAAAFAWLIITNEVRSWAGIERVIGAVALAMAAAGVIGAVGFLGVAELQFRSPFGYLLPESLRATDYGSVIAVRSTGSHAWFALLQQYYRTNSVFLFSTMYAAALAVTLPLLVFVARYARGWRRLAAWGLVALLLVNMLFTTGRVAIVGFAVGAGLYLFRRSGVTLRTLTAMASVVAVLALISLAGPARLMDGIEDVAFARGEGSVAARSVIYVETIAGALQRPVFGWGSERDIEIEGFRYPAGSHSFYLGALYRHGLVGLSLVALLLASVWLGLRPPPRSSTSSAVPRELALHGRWSLTALLVIGLTTSPDVDMSTYLLAWTCLAIVYTAVRLPVGSTASPVTGGGPMCRGERA